METLYDKLGEKRLKQLVDTFYDLVFQNPVIGALFAKSDQNVVKHKQFCFLTQFLGGPPIYNQEFGHPQLRAKHLPHQIDEAAKNEWLRLMKISIDTLDIDDHLKKVVYDCFPMLAERMKNTA